MYISLTQKGQSLIEILFAITIFTMGVVTIGYLILSGLNALNYTNESSRARFLASEGIEAVTSIRDGDFDMIPAGTYGLMIHEGHWVLASSSDVHGKFIRTITIDDIDTDTKDVTSNVVWNMLGGNQKNITYTTRLTNWNQTKGDAGYLDVATDGISLNASSTELSGLRIKNMDATSIVITGMTIFWNASVQLERITIGGNDVFTASTSVPVSSGVPIDIVDYTLEPISGFHTIDAFVFDGSLGNSNLTVLCTLSDGSIRSIYITP